VSDVPAIVLGVSRSGTTLLKAMLDRHSELAIPTESYFVPQLWDRHGAAPDRDAFLDDVGRLERIAEWGLTREAVAARLPARPTFAQAIAAIYGAYAAARGKPRYGDKTPAYMEHLGLLDRAFPGARYVHIVRDGRDAGLSFLAMRRRPRFNWARPRSLAAFAAAWRQEVQAARRFGATRAAGRYLELRYEDLVAEPDRRLRDVCEFLDLAYEPAMLEYHRDADPAQLQDHPRLAAPPTRDVRRWRDEMTAPDQALFEAIAGDLLAALGYERAVASPGPGAEARALGVRALVAARRRSFRLAVAAARRSPAWRLRRAVLRRSAA